MANPLRRRLTGDQLLERLAASDEHAVRQVHDRYYGALVGYAASLLGWSAQDAEDVVQDAMVAGLAAIADGERPRELRPWLYRIVRNRAIDEVRRARRRDASLDAATDDSDAAGGHAAAGAWAAPPHEEPSAVATRRESLRELVIDLAELPDRQRDALLARVVDGESPQGSAERLGVSVAALQMLVVRGRENLLRAREARLVASSVGSLDRQLRALAPPGGLLAALGLANVVGFGGAKAIPAAVGVIAVVAAGGGFAVVKREQARAGEPAPYALTGAGYVLGHRVVRGERIPDGTAVVAATVQIPAGVPGDPADRRVTLQCPSGMRYAEQLSHQTGQSTPVSYRPPEPWQTPRPDGRVTFTFDRKALDAPARVRIRALCRKPGRGDSLLAEPRLPRGGEGRGVVCSKAPYLYREPERLFVGTAFKGQRVTLTSRASRSVFLITDDGIKGWIKTSDLCPGWTSGGNARR